MQGQIKDYYKLLEVQPAATLQEIKKSYRRLAFKYHPDTAGEHTFKAIQFRELQEAYSVLSDTGKRKRYDEERWLAGMSTRARDNRIVTPHWLLTESRRLSHHMATVDTYRMSHSALNDYVFLLLSDSHMAILQHQDEANKDILGQVVWEILKATRNLQYGYMVAVAQRLLLLAGDDAKLQQAIQASLQQRRHLATWEKYLPLIIIIITMLLVGFMYFWSRK